MTHITGSRAEHDKLGLPDSESIVDRVLREGPLTFREATREAGAPMLSYWALLRAWRSGKLDAIKLGGRVLTSAAAVRRWITAANERAVPAPRPRPRRVSRVATSPAARDFLGRRGLPAGGGQ